MCLAVLSVVKVAAVPVTWWPRVLGAVTIEEGGEQQPPLPLDAVSGAGEAGARRRRSHTPGSCWSSACPVSSARSSGLEEPCHNPMHAVYDVESQHMPTRSRLTFRALVSHYAIVRGSEEWRPEKVREGR